MFLVLIEYIEDEGKEWSVVAHGKAGLRSVFPTRAAADAVAMEMAENASNRFAVVQIKCWYQQEVQETVVIETRIG